MFGMNATSLMKSNSLSCRYLVTLLVASSSLAVTVAGYQNDGYCMDTESKFNVCKKIKYTYCEEDELSLMECSNIAETPSLCYYDEFKRNCPITCSSCPEKCEDETGPIKIPYVNKEKFCKFKYIDSEHNLCTKVYTYANHCPKKCKFCPLPPPTISPAPTIRQSFTETRVEDGKFEKGLFGSQMATASLGSKIFVTEFNETTLDLYEYDGRSFYIKVRSYDNVIKSTSHLSTGRKLATSLDGEHLVHAYDTDGDRGKVDVIHRKQGEWNSIKMFNHSGEFVDISDRGNTIMIAEKSKVHVYDYKRVLGEWKKRGYKPIPLRTSVKDIVDVSMTPNGKHFAVSLTSTKGTNKVKCFRLKKKKWRSYAIIDELNEFGEFSTVRLVNNGKTLFVGMKEAFARKGAVFVFDFEKNGYGNSWKLRGAKSTCNIGSVKKWCPSEPSCKALVNITEHRTCNTYCKHHDLDCVGAAENLHDNCTSISDDLKCNNDFVTKYNTSDAICQCKPKIDVNDAVVFKGEHDGDEVGRQLSVSRNGQFVAWASLSSAGTLRWNGDEWSNEETLVTALSPKVSLDSSGKRLVVGLPFTNIKSGSTLLDLAGRLNVFEWSGFDDNMIV